MKHFQVHENCFGQNLDFSKTVSNATIFSQANAVFEYKYIVLVEYCKQEKHIESKITDN